MRCAGANTVGACRGSMGMPLIKSQMQRQPDPFGLRFYSRVSEGGGSLLFQPAVAVAGIPTTPTGAMPSAEKVKRRW